jgi:hypothetical protein
MSQKANSGCEQLQQARPLFDHLIGTGEQPPSPREALILSIMRHNFEIGAC